MLSGSPQTRTPVGNRCSLRRTDDPGGAQCLSKATGQGGAEPHTSQDRDQQGLAVQKGPPAPGPQDVLRGRAGSPALREVNGPGSEGTDVSSCGSPLGQGGPHLP